MNQQQRILILAPHTDDGELGAGGTIARLIRTGNSVYYAAFSTCRQSLPQGWAPDTLEKEARAAMAILGVPSEKLIFFDFEVRYFERDRQHILEEMVRLQREIKPHRVYLPSANDLHQDHITIYYEALRAFKYSNLLGYEMPWNNLQFNANYHIALTEADLSAKIAAMACYQSQQHRSYTQPDFLRAWAITRGIQVNQPLAEAFQLIRWIET